MCDFWALDLEYLPILSLPLERVAANVSGGKEIQGLRRVTLRVGNSNLLMLYVRLINMIRMLYSSFGTIEIHAFQK